MFDPHTHSTRVLPQRSSILGFVVALFVLSVAAAFAGAYPAPYRVVDLGVLPGTTSSVASAINNQGDVVGWATGKAGSRAFVFLAGEGMVELPALTGGGSSLARDINDARQVVGVSDFVKTGSGRAVIWQEGKVDALGSLGGGRWSEAWAINEAGQVVGTAEVGDFLAAEHAFLYDPGLGMIDLTPDVRQSAARGINESGQVTGWSDAKDGSQHAFRYESKALVDLGELPGNHYTFGSSLNDAGVVAGTAMNADGKGSRIFRAHAPEKFEDLSGKYPFAYALAMNNSGVVVGYGYGAITTRALLYTDAHGLQDLNSLISPLEGWVIEAATDINDYGVIVGYAHNSRSRRLHAVRLDPQLVPMPE